MSKSKRNKMAVKASNLKTPPSTRIKWKFTEKVFVEEKYRPFLWDYPEGYAPLEIYLLRILTYGRFEDIRDLFKKFPQETYDIIQRYPQIHRGVKFWIKHWYEGELR